MRFSYCVSRFNELLTRHSVEPGLGHAIKHLIALFEGQSCASDNLEQMGAMGDNRYVENEGDQAWTWKPGTQGYKTIFDILSVSLLTNLT